MSVIREAPLAAPDSCRVAILSYFRARGLGGDEPVALAIIARRLQQVFSPREIIDEITRMLEDGLVVHGGNAYGIKLTSRGVRTTYESAPE